MSRSTQRTVRCTSGLHQGLPSARLGAQTLLYTLEYPGSRFHNLWREAGPRVSCSFSPRGTLCEQVAKGEMQKKGCIETRTFHPFQK